MACLISSHVSGLDQLKRLESTLKNAQKLLGDPLRAKRKWGQPRRMPTELPVGHVWKFEDNVKFRGQRAKLSWSLGEAYKGFNVIFVPHHEWVDMWDTNQDQCGRATSSQLCSANVPSRASRKIAGAEEDCVLEVTEFLNHTLRYPRNDGLQPISDGLQPKSNGLHPKGDGSDGLQPNRDGLLAKSDGLQPKERWALSRERWHPT